ncbi:MAG TPA: PAS domain S-box protein [Polyangiales bacterium]|nr:PAS domain S-box protein [Polyangiales bacterium]
MAIALRILLIADSDRDAGWLTDALAHGNYAPDCVRVDDETRARAALEAGRWDTVVCVFQGARAPAALRSLREREAGVDPALLLVADAFEDVAEAAQRLGATICLRTRGFSHLGPAVERALRERASSTAREEARAFEQEQRVVLEHIAAGRPLPEVLEEIVLLIERQSDGMFCSILLLDAESKRVRHGAAPHLPRELVQGIDGAQIGPHEGSCGAAAYLREAVIIDDIGTHPNWTNYRQLVLPFGLRACWSSPIFDAPGGNVLGTFAMYYQAARKPHAREQDWVACATSLAAIAISRDRAERAARRADARYRQIVDTASEGVWLLDVEARTLFVNQRTAKMLGYSPEELLGRPITEFMDETSRRAAEGNFVQRLRTSNEQFEFRFRRKDRSAFWALVSGSPVQEDKREVAGALGMITDITALKRTEQALRQSEAEVRVVFEGAAIGMALIGADGRVLRSNAALQHFLGWEETELAARPFTDFSHPEDLESDRALHLSFKSGTRQTFQSDKRYVRKDGAVVWGRLTASLVQPQRDVPRSVIAMIEDVTVRRTMEEAVRSSERLRSLMYGAVTDVLFYVGVEPGQRFRFLSVNPAFLRTTGLREDQVVGRMLDEVIPEPSRSQVIQNYLRAIHERRTLTWDEVSSYPSGVKYGEVSITPLFDDNGSCTNLVGTVHDVTERRKAELRVAEQAALLDKANDAIAVRDLDGVIQYWNKGAERVYGWTSAETIGQNLRNLIYRDTKAFERAQQHLIEDGHWMGELVQFTKAGRRIIVDCSWTLIRDELGGVRSVLVINTDITARKNLEVQVLHAQRLDSLGTLAGGVAHDFNNLLTVIRASLELTLADLPKEESAHRFLAEAETAASRGAELVRQLLTFSRREESKRRIVRLQPLVSEALGLLRVTLPSTVRLETRFEPDVPEVLADPTQIHQVVMNLGTNAIHAMRERGGRLELRLQRVVLEAPLDAHSIVLRPGTYAQLIVADTGVGIDMATLDHIFDPFFTTKGLGEGTGLGLSVVHGIVRSHEGGIVVRSTPSRGTEFDVYLPAAIARSS